MSGHSKWANIKHRKGKQDEQKGKAFTKLGRELIVAAKIGGPNPEANFRLKIAIQKAKAANMPNENIQRAIQRGAGGQESGDLEELVYEGYGPGGAAIMVSVLTDNRNRTAGEIRHIFSKNGGNLGETGCVSWMFEEKGVLTINKEGLSLSEDDLLLLALDKGAEDIRTGDDETVEIITSPQDFQSVKEGLEKEGIASEDAEITMIPKNTVEVKDPEQARLLLRLMERLDEHDDVQNSYTNFEIPDELMAGI
ncbi:MAG: YebC/PmpR family DNA-binding transcriptional regulator [Peptococcaceae bacterium]|jgi:YebC/PmpR family DNA-binding regulatory protein|nr:YebC/PmpR family DNA-binding transcriptional regulator [Peptococcaceae bacterium]MDH7525112.1 YebC/PmpR family DNA-binding transcriptional regulator [Peptococcaceae bacterium]